MNDLYRRALKIAAIPAIIYFLFPFVLGLINKNYVEGLFSGLLGGLLFGFLVFIIAGSAIKNKVELTWYLWIFYVIGWATGIFNLLFWIIMYVAHLSHNYGDPFIGKDFHRRVWMWGIFSFCIIAFFYLILPTVFLVFKLITH